MFPLAGLHGRGSTTVAGLRSGAWAFILAGLLVASSVAGAQETDPTSGAIGSSPPEVPASDSLHWWQRYPLPASGPLQFMTAIGADTAVPAVHVDIGLGLAHVDAVLDRKHMEARMLDDAGLKWVPYAEAAGTFGAYAVRIEEHTRKDEPFTHITDTHWTDSWDRLEAVSPGKIVLDGMPAFLTGADWLLKLPGSSGRSHVRSLGDFGLLPICFPPDSATDSAKVASWRDVVDAGASKADDGIAYCTSVDLSASLRDKDELIAALGLPKHATRPGVAPQPGTYMDWGKDILNPFWTSYDQRIARLYVKELGAWGVHYDNFSGFDFLSWQPRLRGFGDWSVHRFREFLREHDIVADPATFDVRSHVATKYPGDDPRWLDDPVWRALLVFKRQALRDYLQALADNVHNLARETGRDLAILGNDLPYADSNGAVLPSMLDVSSSETDPYDHSPYTRYGIGLPPRGRMAVWYLLQAAKTSGGFVFPWYYLNGDDASKPNLARVLLFEGLAHKAMLVAAAPDGAHSRPGDADTLRSFNSFVRTVRPYWLGRKAAANVGLLFSGDSQMADQMPARYHDHLHINEFYGWGQFLVEEHAQWRAVLTESMDGFLTAESSDLLIVPHAVSLSSSVAGKLAKWVSSGGRVIVTGQSGTRADAAGLLAAQPGSLAALTGEGAPEKVGVLVHDVGKGRVVSVAGTPGAAFCRDPGTPRAEGRDLLRKAFDAAGGADLAHSRLLATNGDRDLGLKVYESPEQRKLYVDLFNYRLSDPDTLAPHHEVTVSLRLPGYLDGVGLAVYGFASGAVTARARLFSPALYAVTNGGIEIRVGTVRSYNALVIQPADVTPVVIITRPAWDYSVTPARTAVAVDLEWISSTKDELFSYVLEGPDGIIAKARTDRLHIKTSPLVDGRYSFTVWPSRLGPGGSVTRTFLVDTEGPGLHILMGPQDGEEIELVEEGLFNAYFAWQAADPCGVKHFAYRLQRPDGQRETWTRTTEGHAGFRITHTGHWQFQLRAFDIHDHPSAVVSRTFTVILSTQGTTEESNDPDDTP